MGSGLWLSQIAMDIEELTDGALLLLCHVASFGDRGCWQTDEQIGKALRGKSARTIQRYIRECKKLGAIFAENEHSARRKMWVIDEEALRQMCPTTTTDVSEYSDNNDVVLRQMCPTTVTGREQEENNKKTTAKKDTLPNLSKDGPLEEHENYRRFSKKFRRVGSLSTEEFEKSRAAAREALTA